MESKNKTENRNKANSWLIQIEGQTHKTITSLARVDQERGKGKAAIRKSGMKAITQHFGGLSNVSIETNLTPIHLKI